MMNAKITDAEVTLDRGCFLSMWFTLEFDIGCQGFGGYVFCTPVEEDGRVKRIGTAWGAQKIREAMEIFDVEKFSNIKGKICRFERSNGDTFSAKIIKIGHPYKDKWLSFDDAEEFNKKYGRLL